MSEIPLETLLEATLFSAGRSLSVEELSENLGYEDEEILESMTDIFFKENMDLKSKIDTLQRKSSQSLERNIKFCEYLKTNKNATNNEDEKVVYQQVYHHFLKTVKLEQIEPEPYTVLDADYHESIPIPSEEEIERYHEEENLILKIIEPGLKFEGEVLIKSRVYVSLKKENNDE